MKDHIKEYKERLEKGICEYMDNNVTERSAEAVYHMLKCWNKVNDLEKKKNEEMLTAEDAKCWAYNMKNADGTEGAHWSMDDTTSVAESYGIDFSHINKDDWYIVLNMMYSDYGAVAEKYGVSTVDFFVDMAKAFLFDKDGGAPAHKVAAYYNYIVKEAE